MSYPNPHGPSCPWYDITEKTGAPNIKWCEETLCQWISEPANTWSNLSYLIFAIVVMYISKKKNHNKNMRQFGPIIFFMGAMSLFYHLSNFYGSQILDFVGMFFFVGWAIGMNLIRLGKLKYKNLIWFNLGLGTLYTIIMHLMYINHIKFQLIVLFSAFLIVATELFYIERKQLHYKWYLASLVLMGIAYGFQIADKEKYWCHPTEHGWFSQGHAVWHWIAGVAMLTIYLHYAQPALKPTEER